MNIRTYSRLLLGAAILTLAISALAAPRVAYAITQNGTAKNVHYEVAFRLQNTNGIPYTGEMLLNFNNGYVQGKYWDSSVKPGGPLANKKNVTVQGGVSGNNIHFSIGNLSFFGQVNDSQINGTLTARGQRYTFQAQQTQQLPAE